MQYLGDYRIDDYITLGAQLHQFSSGGVYAPTGNVTYTFYENNSTSGAPTGGNLSQLNSKTGLYTARVQLTSVAGFEAGKEYLVHIEATVDGVAAAELLMFRVIALPTVNVTQIEGSDATDQIRDAVVDDATRIDASALNTLSGHDPGEAIMGATDLGTGAGLTTLATASALSTVAGYLDTEVADIKTTTDKLATALELDVAVYRFTANALEMAPGGGGVGSDANIVSIAGVPVNTATAQLGVNVVSVATNAIAADSLADDAATEVADAVLLRGVENVEASATAHTLATAILHSTGRTRRNLQTLETYRSDGTTLHMTQALTPDPAGQPVSEIGDGTTV